MIHMPHRSVTRFFVPLIDVLLLLFCIFLLMPLADEAAVEKQLEKGYQSEQDLESLGYQYDLIKRENDEFMKANPDAVENLKLKKEIERLKDLLQQNPRQKYNFEEVDIDQKGNLSYFDRGLPAAKAKVPIANEADARQFIHKLKEKHEREASLRGDSPRKLYLFFIYPRPQLGYPGPAEIARYRRWFKGVDTSLPSEGGS